MVEGAAGAHIALLFRRWAVGRQTLAATLEPALHLRDLTGKVFTSIKWIAMCTADV